MTSRERFIRTLSSSIHDISQSPYPNLRGIANQRGIERGRDAGGAVLLHHPECKHPYTLDQSLIIQDFQQSRREIDLPSAGFSAWLMSGRARANPTTRPPTSPMQHQIGLQDLLHLLGHGEELLAGHGNEAPVAAPGAAVDVPDTLHVRRRNSSC